MLDPDNSTSIIQGNKIIKISIGKHISFVDSLNHLTGSIASLPKSYKLEDHVKKGYFPYKFLNIANINYTGPIPGKEYFCTDSMNSERINDFNSWYEDVKNAPYNLRNELFEYCENDVLILAMAMTEYASSMKKSFNVNVLDFTTKASMSHAIWRRDALPKNKILLINKKKTKQFSVESIIWLKIMEEKNGVNIQTGESFFGEKRLYIPSGHPRKTFYLDGYSEIDNTAYLFHGCFYHGCKSCYDKGRIKSFIGGKT